MFRLVLIGSGTFGKKIPVRLFSVVREPWIDGRVNFGLQCIWLADEYTNGLQSGKINCLECCGQFKACRLAWVHGLCNGLGNFRQKDSGALIFSSAGTLNRRKSIQMACSPVRVMSRSIHSGLCRSAQELSAKRSLHGLAGGSWVE